MSLSIRFVFTSFPEGAGPGSEGEERLDELLPDLHRGRSEAVFELRRTLTKGLLWFVRRTMRGKNVDLLVLTVVDIVVAALKSGRLTSGEDILSFTRSVAVERMDEAGCYPQRMHLPTPEKREVAAMKRALDELGSLDREAIGRYVRGDNPARICSDLTLSLSEFAGLRARVKSRFAQLSGVPELSAEDKLTGWVRAHIA